MNKKEAIQAMLDGKTVVFDGNGWKLEISEGVFVSARTGMKADINEMVTSDKWEIYQEPKRKVRFYRYLMSCGEDTSHWFSEDFKIMYIPNTRETITSPSVANKEKWVKIHGAYIEIEV